MEKGLLVRRALLCSLAGVLVLAYGSSAGASGPARFDRDDAQDCDALVGEPVPEAYATPLETTPRLNVRVYVLLDGIPIPRGQQIMTRVAKAYDAIGIDLTAEYQEVTIEPDAIDDEVGGTGQPAHGDALMPAIKNAVGGARPWGTDVVYAMTSDNIANAAGYTECIGGVRFGGHAFAVGEAWIDPGMEVGPVSHERSAKIAAHEIAHLLGAHHHYANCAEAPRDAGGGVTLLVAEACTVLINDIGLASLGWSTLEAAVVRGHVAEFAIGATMGPEPRHERQLVFRINKKGVGKGAIDSEVAECIGTSVVSLEHKTSDTWSTVAEVESNPTADYTFEGPLAGGTYRTSVSASYFEGETHRETCPAVVSRVVKTLQN